MRRPQKTVRAVRELPLRWLTHLVIAVSAETIDILGSPLNPFTKFDAPIELRVYGSEMEQLRQLGNQLRGELAQVEQVTHTQATLTEALPKLALNVDEVQGRRIGLDNSAIARQLDTALEGTLGGSILEGTEDIPVRVRLSNQQRSDLTEIASLDLVAGNRNSNSD